MSPVAPRRARSPRSVSLAIGGVVVALGLAVALFVFAIPAITTKNQAAVKQGAATMSEGSAADRAHDIARSGPILLPDQAGGQRDILLQHLGSDPAKGWYAFDARRPGKSRLCTLRWNAHARHFDDPCGGAPVAADGAGLVHYHVTVTSNGDLVIDLNPNDETNATQSGATTTSSSSTTSSVLVTGTLPKKP
jgi:hypothetical protein